VRPSVRRPPGRIGDALGRARATGERGRQEYQAHGGAAKRPRDASALGAAPFESSRVC